MFQFCWGRGPSLLWNHSGFAVVFILLPPHLFFQWVHMESLRLQIHTGPWFFSSGCKQIQYSQKCHSVCMHFWDTPSPCGWRCKKQYDISRIWVACLTWGELPDCSLQALKSQRGQADFGPETGVQSQLCPEWWWSYHRNVSRLWIVCSDGGKSTCPQSPGQDIPKVQLEVRPETGAQAHRPPPHSYWFSRLFLYYTFTRKEYRKNAFLVP